MTRHPILLLALPALTMMAVACGDDEEDLAVAVGNTALDAPSTSAPQGVAASGPANTGVADSAVGFGENCDTDCTSSVVINVTNSSSKVLDFGGNNSNTPENIHNGKPKAVLNPGETDSFEIKTSIASGVLYQPFWVVNGTGDTVQSLFQVPTVGSNEKSCAGDPFTPASKAISTTCSIGHGYHPTATLVFTDR